MTEERTAILREGLEAYGLRIEAGSELAIVVERHLCYECSLPSGSILTISKSLCEGFTSSTELLNEYIV